MPFPSIELNNGVKMPLLGLGTYSDPLVQNDPETIEAVYEAIKMGYRHIDTAYIYKSEFAVGQGVKKAIDEGIVTREEVFVCTKIWPTNFKRERLFKQAEESNQLLGLGYIDLLILHAPIPMKDPKGDAPEVEEVDIHRETYPALEELYHSGVAKSIGVSNWSISLLKELLSLCKVPPTVNQVESQPHEPNTELIQFCQKNNVQVVAYSPFGGGWAPEEGRAHTPIVGLAGNPIIQKIAAKHKKSAQQVLLRFHIDRNVCPIPKSYNKGRLAANMEIFDFKLDEDDMKKLHSIEDGRRFNLFIDFKDHKYYPFKEYIPA